MILTVLAVTLALGAVISIIGEIHAREKQARERQLRKEFPFIHRTGE